MPDHNRTAPGDLEIVRRFMNTWSITNETRAEADTLPELARSPVAWQNEFPNTVRSRADTLEKLRRLRSDLRASCRGVEENERALNEWFRTAALGMEVRSVDGTTRLTVEAVGTSFADYLVAAVANAIASSEWAKLKTCPDCQGVFFDYTRNGSKRWCGMTKGGPGGRACGTIAKVAAFRAREAAKKSA